ncbi:hypothetical protein Q7C36_012079 [Tachysurus vachellii]|uniref:C2H2-type domain-containing protein n=1 Tax=Tachysurus vachellii TaxID=175792 RepID=A0AA88MSR2_TACVA|nr:hypothetical protein Q7C36_012079 [Tachysurus vachellii]
MISGSVSGVKDTEDVPTDLGHNGLDHPPVDISLEDGSNMLVDGFERTLRREAEVSLLQLRYQRNGAAHRAHPHPHGRHKILPTKGTRSTPPSHRRTISALSKRGGAFAYGRRILVDLGLHRKSDADENGGANDERNDLHSPYISLAAKDVEKTNDLEHNPLSQLSALAGQLSSLPSETPASPGADSLPEEKPSFLIQSSPAISSNVSCPIVTLTSMPDIRDTAHGGHNSGTNSQPGTPNPSHEPQLLHHCPHCHIYFPDNVLYTIHMGCHGYENPFQCNICGHRCRNRYDFACHFARGQHKQ